MQCIEAQFERGKVSDSTYDLVSNLWDAAAIHAFKSPATPGLVRPSDIMPFLCLHIHDALQELVLRCGLECLQLQHNPELRKVLTDSVRRAIYSPSRLLKFAQVPAETTRSPVDDEAEQSGKETPEHQHKVPFGNRASPIQFTPSSLYDLLFSAKCMAKKLLDVEKIWGLSKPNENNDAEHLWDSVYLACICWRNKKPLKKIPHVHLMKTCASLLESDNLLQLTSHFLQLRQDSQMAAKVNFWSELTKCQIGEHEHVDPKIKSVLTQYAS